MRDVLEGRRWVTDGGLETDLLFSRGVELPHFAAFPLLEDEAGRGLLREYYAGYAEVAAAAGAGLVLETPTWRANPDWGLRLGYDAAGLDAVNRGAVDFLRRVQAGCSVDQVLVSGVIGPRGDGYVPAGSDPDEAATYHAAQVRSLGEAGADLVHAMTISEPTEAIGIIRAAREVDLPVVVSFTVEVDGRLPDGSTLAEAIATTDDAGGPDWYGINCAHPLHVLQACPTTLDADGVAWTRRVRGFRPNASTLSHAELDVMEELDPGDIEELVTSTRRLQETLSEIAVLGGCCGTDVRHVTRLWDL